MWIFPKLCQNLPQGNYGIPQKQVAFKSTWATIMCLGNSICSDHWPSTNLARVEFIDWNCAKLGTPSPVWMASSGSWAWRKWGDGRLKTWGEILMAPLRGSFLLSGVPLSPSLLPCEERVYKKYRSAEKKNMVWS